MGKNNDLKYWKEFLVGENCVVFEIYESIVVIGYF